MGVSGPLSCFGISLSLVNQRSAWAVISSASILASLAMTLGDCLELSDQLQFPLGFRILVPRAYILGSPSVWNIDSSWSLSYELPSSKTEITAC